MMYVPISSHPHADIVVISSVPTLSSAITAEWVQICKEWEKMRLEEHMLGSIVLFTRWDCEKQDNADYKKLAREDNKLYKNY